MSTPLITIFVRHSPGCKYAGDEFCKRCNCRKHLRWSQGGTQYRKSAGSRSWEGAEAEKRRLEDQLAGRVSESKGTATQQTIRAAVALYNQTKEVQEIKAAGLRRYQTDLGRFVSFCEGRGVFTLLAINFETLIAFAATWPAQYPASSTRRLVRARLLGFLHFCIETGWLIRMPGKLPPVKVDYPPTMPLTETEYQDLLAAVDLEFKNGTAGRLRAIIQLMRWSGLAVRDASCLRRDSLELTEAYSARVTVSRQKTGTPVSVVMPLCVGRDLLAAATGAEYLFWDPLKSTAVTFAHERGLEIARCFERAGIKNEGHMISHRLRDTFAVDLLTKGVPLEAVSKMLGHTQISTTEKHYAQWVKGRQDRLDNLVTATWETK